MNRKEWEQENHRLRCVISGMSEESRLMSQRLFEAREERDRLKEDLSSLFDVGADELDRVCELLGNCQRDEAAEAVSKLKREAERLRSENADLRLSATHLERSRLRNALDQIEGIARNKEAIE